MAKLVRFDPDPEYPELGQAHFDDGTSLYTSAGALPPELTAPDMRIAENDAPVVDWSQPPDLAGMARAVEADQQARLDAPASAIAQSEQANAAVRAAQQTADESVLGQAPVNPANAPVIGHNPPPVAQGPQTVGQLPGTGEPAAAPVHQGTDVNPFAAAITAPVYVGGKPAVDPQRMIREGVMVPKGGSVVTEAGAPYSPEEAQLRQQAAKDVALAHIATARSEITRAEAEKQASEVALPVLRKKAEENQRDFDALQAGYRMERARVQREIDEFDRTAKVDPKKFFADRPVWGVIGAMIAQALGAYGATLGRTENFAAKIINQAIEDDIDAQKANLEQGRIGHKNALSRLQDQLGDVQQAEAALRLSQHAVVQKEIASFAAAARSEDIGNKATEWLAQYQQEQIDRELAFYHASLGKKTSTTEQSFVQPQAGTRGFARPPTLEEMAKRSSAAKTIFESDQTVRGVPEPQKPEDVSKDVQEYGKRKQAIAQARTRLKQAAEAVGLALNPDGTVTVPKDWQGAAGYGATSSIPMGWLSEEGRKARQGVEAFLSSYAKAISGAAVTEPEMERLRAQTVGSWDKDLATGIANAWTSLNQEESTIDSSFNSQARGQFQQNRGQVTREQSASKVKAY